MEIRSNMAATKKGILTTCLIGPLLRIIWTIKRENTLGCLLRIRTRKRNVSRYLRRMLAERSSTQIRTTLMKWINSIVFTPVTPEGTLLDLLNFFTAVKQQKKPVLNIKK